MDIARNEFGIPLHCMDCAVVAPTLDEVRDLESANLLVSGMLEDSIYIHDPEEVRIEEIQADIHHLIARKMVKLGILVDRTDSCAGAKLMQAHTPNGEYIHHIACGC